MKILSFLFTVLFGYIIGSVNLSILVTKYIGKFDIHTRGSGNAGGTNVARTMGAKYGIPVIVLEIVKCFAVGLCRLSYFPFRACDFSCCFSYDKNGFGRVAYGGNSNSHFGCGRLPYIRLLVYPFCDDFGGFAYRNFQTPQKYRPNLQGRRKQIFLFEEKTIEYFIASAYYISEVIFYVYRKRNGLRPALLR